MVDESSQINIIVVDDYEQMSIKAAEMVIA